MMDRAAAPAGLTPAVCSMGATMGSAMMLAPSKKFPKPRAISKCREIGRSRPLSSQITRRSREPVATKSWEKRMPRKTTARSGTVVKKPSAAASQTTAHGV